MTHAQQLPTICDWRSWNSESLEPRPSESKAWTVSYSSKLPDYACIQGTAETSMRVSGSCPSFHLGLLVYIDIVNPGMEVILKGHLIHSPRLKLSWQMRSYLNSLPLQKKSTAPFCLLFLDLTAPSTGNLIFFL